MPRQAHRHVTPIVKLLIPSLPSPLFTLYYQVAAVCWLCVTEEESLGGFLMERDRISKIVVAFMIDRWFTHTIVVI